MAKKLFVSPSPHIHSGDSTQKIMLLVIIALVPALVMSVIFYGIGIVWLTLAAIVSCMAFEWIFAYLLKRKSSINDFSGALTGFLLAFNLPSSTPLGLVVLGSLVAIGLGKMTYGGLGQNIFNPALVGRVFLLIAFPVQMTSFPESANDSLEVFSGATPLSYYKEMAKSGADLQTITSQLPLTDFISAMKRGSIGEVSSIALLAGFVFLLVKKVITWHIPVAVLGSMLIFSGIFYLIDPSQYLDPVTHIFAGGAILGAVYMATDYVTSPMSVKGMLIYGVLIGIITMLIRFWGSYPEGISFAILIMNSFVPLINRYMKPKRFGENLKKKEA